MATSKLYPTLSAFYKNTYVGFGSEANIVLETPDSNAHKKSQKSVNKKHDSVDVRKERPLPQLERGSKDRKNQSGGKRASHYTEYTQSDNRHTDVLPVIQDIEQLTGYLTSSTPCLPTAPPLDWSDELIERFLEDTLTQQELSSIENDFANVDTPNVDYSTLRSSIVATDDLDVSWVDDLIPDYDTLPEEGDINTLNNLNKEETREPQSPTMSVNNILELNQEISSQPVNSTVESSRHSQPYFQHYPPRQSRKVKTTSTKQTHEQPRVRSQHVSNMDKENKPNTVESSPPPPPGTEEYNAWMTWRKQVNRQLATIILLRNNGHVHIQKSDLSRKPLNQSSYDFISQFSRCGQRTRLGSKPYVMYGIPRVSLPASS